MTPKEIRGASLEIVRGWGLEPLPHLPLPDPVKMLRSSTQVAHRLMCLYALTGLSEGIAGTELLPWLEAEGAASELLTEEVDLFRNRRLSKRQTNALSWKSESMATLAWAGKVLDGSLLPPKEMTHWDRFFPRIPPAVSVASFLDGFSLRATSEVCLQVDIHYLTHAAIRHEAHRVFNICIVEERRMALEWLVDPNRPWNEISLDT